MTKMSAASLPPIQAGEACPEDPLHQSCALSELNLERIRTSAPGGSWRNWPPQLVTSCHREQDRISWTASYGRMTWHRPAPTITTTFLTYVRSIWAPGSRPGDLPPRRSAIAKFSAPISFRPEIYIKTCHCPHDRECGSAEVGSSDRSEGCAPYTEVRLSQKPTSDSARQSGFR